MTELNTPALGLVTTESAQSHPRSHNLRNQDFNPIVNAPRPQGCVFALSNQMRRVSRALYMHLVLQGPSHQGVSATSRNQAQVALFLPEQIQNSLNAEHELPKVKGAIEQIQESPEFKTTLTALAMIFNHHEGVSDFAKNELFTFIQNLAQPPQPTNTQTPINKNSSSALSQSFEEKVQKGAFDLKKQLAKGKYQQASDKSTGLTPKDHSVIKMLIDRLPLCVTHQTQPQGFQDKLASIMDCVFSLSVADTMKECASNALVALSGLGETNTAASAVVQAIHAHLESPDSKKLSADLSTVTHQYPDVKTLAQTLVTAFKGFSLGRSSVRPQDIFDQQKKHVISQLRGPQRLSPPIGHQNSLICDVIDHVMTVQSLIAAPSMCPALSISDKVQFQFNLQTLAINLQHNLDVRQDALNLMQELNKRRQTPLKSDPQFAFALQKTIKSINALNRTKLRLLPANSELGVVAPYDPVRQHKRKELVSLEGAKPGLSVLETKAAKLASEHAFSGSCELNLTLGSSVVKQAASSPQIPMIVERCNMLCGILSHYEGLTQQAKSIGQLSDTANASQSIPNALRDASHEFERTHQPFSGLVPIIQGLIKQGRDAYLHDVETSFDLEEPFGDPDISDHSKLSTKRFQIKKHYETGDKALINSLARSVLKLIDQFHHEYTFIMLPYFERYLDSVRSLDESLQGDNHHQNLEFAQMLVRDSKAQVASFLTGVKSIPLGFAQFDDGFRALIEQFFQSIQTGGEQAARACNQVLSAFNGRISAEDALIQLQGLQDLPVSILEAAKQLLNRALPISGASPSQASINQFVAIHSNMAKAKVDTALVQEYGFCPKNPSPQAGVMQACLMLVNLFEQTAFSNNSKPLFDYLNARQLTELAIDHGIYQVDRRDDLRKLLQHKQKDAQLNVTGLALELFNVLVDKALNALEKQPDTHFLTPKILHIATAQSGGDSILNIDAAPTLAGLRDRYDAIRAELGQRSQGALLAGLDAGPASRDTLVARVGLFEPLWREFIVPQFEDKNAGDNYGNARTQINKQGAKNAPDKGYVYLTHVIDSGYAVCLELSILAAQLLTQYGLQAQVALGHRAAFADFDSSDSEHAWVEIFDQNHEFIGILDSNNTKAFHPSYKGYQEKFEQQELRRHELKLGTVSATSKNIIAGLHLRMERKGSTQLHE